MNTPAHALGALAAFAAEAAVEEMSEDVLHGVRRRLLDAIGCGLAAAGEGSASTGTAVVEAARAWGGVREAGVLGLDFRVPAAQAALATGTLVHALDYDDAHIPSVVHASAAVVPAALAVADEAGADGPTFLAALACGTEIACRIGAAAPSLRDQGFDPTGFCGTYGAAAAAGRLWGLSAQQMTSALGLAGAVSGGLLGSQAGDSDVIRLRSGWAAMTGVIAADLARRGFIGPSSILEGPHALYDAAAAIADLGEEWESSRIAIKPYPSCHFTHAYADAAARAGVKPGDVEEIICLVHPSIIPVVCEPRSAKAAPQTATQARFSLPFAIATAMVGGRGPLEMFGADARSDRRVLSLAERVHYEPDATLPHPQIYAGRIVVNLRDGRTRSVEEEINRGHPDRPLTDDDVRSKFFVNARKRLDAAEATKLADEVWRLRSLDSVEQLLSLTQIT